VPLADVEREVYTKWGDIEFCSVDCRTIFGKICGKSGNRFDGFGERLKLGAGGKNTAASFGTLAKQIVQFNGPCRSH
jgi:hypothetical protein